MLCKHILLGNFVLKGVCAQMEIPAARRRGGGWSGVATGAGVDRDI